MKKVLILALLVVTATTLSLAGAAAPDQTGDILGAHNAYGRGCVSCHAPHSGPAGNGAASSKAAIGNMALWGQDLTPLYGAQLKFGDYGAYTVTLPSTYSSPFDATTGIMMCLSCHDGNMTSVSMMKGQTVEQLPVVGGNAPTLLGTDGVANATSQNYLNDHPVGPNATVGCNGFNPDYYAFDWDCTINTNAGGSFTSLTPGPNMTVFEANYGFTVELYDNGAGKPMVTCMSCHDQHSQTAYHGTIAGAAGNYKTMFFVKGYYNPSTGSNSVSQFCRQCHGGEANEQHGVMSVPTV